MHAYGLAVDLNPVANHYVGCGQSRDPAARPYRDRSRHRPGMVTPGVVNAFHSIRWGWGGAWTGNTKDYCTSRPPGTSPAPPARRARAAPPVAVRADAPRAQVEAEAGAAPLTVRELPPLAAAGLGIGPGQSLHVRPDGVPAGRCAVSAKANSGPPRPNRKASTAPRSSTPSLTAERGSSPPSPG
jgi:D-alanyl-D-alanine carboxypeptidase